jgi:predicted enzyme related to lactoylglutathione lyase
VVHNAEVHDSKAVAGEHGPRDRVIFREFGISQCAGCYGDRKSHEAREPRQSPQHTITNYIMVASVDKAAEKLKKLGGKVIMPKAPVPHMGYFVICQDPENNVFALWERNEKAA